MVTVQTGKIKRKRKKGETEGGVLIITEPEEDLQSIIFQETALRL